MRRTNLHFIPFILALLFVALGDVSFAGTGGAELTSLWNEVVNGLQGFWGKLIAVAFLGFSLVALKGGNVLMAVTMFVIAMTVGVIPGIIDARFTLVF